jgi:nitroimidazol reductase NimA-like FMN-containing flavoprotein (pyridoxamine 5'-phosphate oxidase superfamily)
MPVKLSRMNEDEIDEVIQDQMLCRIAFKRKDYPYIAPFQ